MSIYIIWREYGETVVSEFDETEEGYRKAQKFVLKLKNNHGASVDKVILGSEMEIKDVEVVSEVRLTAK